MTHRGHVAPGGLAGPASAALSGCLCEVVEKVPQEGLPLARATCRGCREGILSQT